MPRTKTFVHLHNHSDYSLLDGATSIERMAKLASSMGMPAAALTDHGNMFGAVTFYQKMKQAGVKPIVGCEAYVAPGSRHDRQARPGEKPYTHLTLLVRDAEGWRNLTKLTTAGYLEGFYHKPRVDADLLKEHAGGLIALSGCLSGEVQQAGLRNDMPGLVRAATRWREIFGAENFYLEVQDQGIPEQARLNEMLRDASRKHGFPLVVTNDCHFPRREDFEAHRVLLAIQTGRTLDEGTGMGHTVEHYFKSPEEMWERFGKDWAEALENTAAVAGRCGFELETGKMILPDFQIPSGEYAEDYFRRMAAEGLERRMREGGVPAASRETYVKRLQEETEIILRLHFTGYFLIVADFIRHARERGIPVGPGRGSVGGSLVAWALGITAIDPMPYGLMFERFLNPERVSPPDIDIDFCERRRGEVLQYVTEKYGRGSVAQIITFGTMKARAVVRDVGRAMGLSYAETDRIAKMIPNELGITLDRALKAVPDLAREAEENPAVKKLLEQSMKLEGLVRHASIHAAGVVIAPGEVSDFVPLYRTDKDEVVTQFAKEAVEDMGLMKMDFLGLRTLTLLDDAARALRAEGAEVNVDALPMGDRETYALFSRGDTYAVFQFESGGMRDVLRRLKPDRFEDLIALNALYRPGPLQGGVIDDYVKRRHGKEQARYLIPQLKPILEETYGIIVYQEQVMRIAQEIAGFSLGGGDILRRAMGKKKHEEMQKQRERFLSGAGARGVPAKKAGELFDLVEKFAGYGFNKSHSTAYALVAYQTAYMKAHYPVHFMAAVLNSFKGDTRNIVEAVQECRAMGIEVLPPDVNRSEMDFTVREGKILYGLSSIKNIGEKALESILEARRAAGGRLSSFLDLVAKTDTRLCNQKVWESLIKAGALDSLGYRRSQLAAVLEQALAQSQATQRNGLKSVGLLFEDDPVMRDDKRLMPDIGEWPDEKRLSGEREVLGFYIQGSPLDRFREEIAHFATADTRTLCQQPDRSEQALAGIVHKVRGKTTRRGTLMGLATVEDNYGSVEVLFFPEVYERCKDTLREEAMLLLQGAVDVVTEGKEAKLLAESAVPLEGLRRRRGRAVLIETNAIGFEDGMLDELQNLFARHPGDKPVHLRLKFPHRFAVKMDLSPACRVAPTEEFFRGVESLLGAHSVKLEL